MGTFKDMADWALRVVRKWFSGEPEPSTAPKRLPYRQQAQIDRRMRLQRRKARNEKARKEAIKNNGEPPPKIVQRRHSKPLGHRQQRKLGLIGKSDMVPVRTGPEKGTHRHSDEARP